MVDDQEHDYFTLIITTMQKITSLLLGVAMAAMLVPSTTFAATTPADNFCTRLSGREADLDKATAQRESSVSQYQQDQIARIAKNRADQDKQIELNRANQDTEFAKRISHLEARAKTQTQKDAVATYQSTINAATVVRRASIDSASNTFRTGVDAAVTARHSGMKSAVSAFIGNIDTAIAKAKTDCTANVKPSTVQRAFQNDLDAARSTFKTAKSNLPNLVAQIETLRASRVASVETARGVFKTAARAAKTALENAFK